MRKQISSWVVGAALMTALLVIPTPAQAEAEHRHPSCVKKSEFSSLDQGTTRSSAHQALGTNGRAAWTKKRVVIASVPPGSTLSPTKVVRVKQARNYRSCDPSKSYQIVFVRRVVDGDATPFRLRGKVLSIA